MGKHLSWEEKINAVQEKQKIVEQIKENRKQYQELMYRKKRFDYYIHHKPRSKYNGQPHGLCYQLFGKKAQDMTPQEKHIYDALAQRKERQKRKGKNNV